ncbi:MAG TPA: hypothetical protein VGC92_13410 [Phenylobacterium sp.]|jgi:hypothetical protein
MLTTRLFAAATALVFAGAAQAADTAKDPGKPNVAAVFGNTIVSVYPDGRSQKIWIHPDGTWSGKSRRGLDLAGKWDTKGEKVCLRQTKPPTLPISFCQAFPKDPDVGLTSKDLTGTPIHLKIVKGISEAGD